MLKERKAQEEKEETKIEQVKNTKEERNIKNEDGESKKEKEREKVDPTKTDLDEEQHEVKIEKNESESESKKCSDSDGLLKPNLSPKHRRSQVILKCVKKWILKSLFQKINLRMLKIFEKTCRTNIRCHNSSQFNLIFILFYVANMIICNFPQKISESLKHNIHTKSNIFIFAET